MPRLDAVRITVALARGDADRAAAALGLVAEAARTVYFCERGPSLFLHDRGVILRLGDGGSGGDESTAELRPCRRARLTPPWLALDHVAGQRFRLEEVWASERLLSASLRASLPGGSVASARGGQLPVRRLFTGRQQAFLAECADLSVPFGELTLLGPVHVHACGQVQWHSYDVSAAWWGAPGVDDILELTLRVEVAGAEVVWRGFHAKLLGLGVEQRRWTTETMLKQLIRR